MLQTQCRHSQRKDGRFSAHIRLHGGKVVTGKVPVMACNWTDQTNGWNTLAGSSNRQQDDCNWNWDCSPVQCQPGPSPVTPLPAMLRRAMSPNQFSMDCTGLDCSYDYFEAMNALQNDIRVHPVAESVAILTGGSPSQAARDTPHWSTTSTCTVTSMPFAPTPSFPVPSDPTAVSVPSQRIDTTCSSEVGWISRHGAKAKKPGEAADLANIIGQNWHSARKHRSGRVYHTPTDGQLDAQLDRTLASDCNQQKTATGGRLDQGSGNCGHDDATVRQYLRPNGVNGSWSLSSLSVNNASPRKHYFPDVQSMRALNSFFSSTSHCDVPPNVVAPMCSLPRVSSCLSARPTASPIGCPQNRCYSNGAICSSTAGSSSGSTAFLQSATSRRMINTNSNTTNAQRAMRKRSRNVERCYRSKLKPAEKKGKETRLQNGINQLHTAVIATTRRIISGTDNVGAVDQPRQNATSSGTLGTTNDTNLRQLLNSLSDHPYRTPPPAQINGACAVERPTVRPSPRPVSESWMARSGLLYSTNAPTPAYLCPSSQLAVKSVKSYFSSHSDVTTSRTASVHFPNVTTAVSQCADGTGAADLHRRFPLNFQQRHHPISQLDPINCSAGSMHHVSSSEQTGGEQIHSDDRRGGDVFTPSDSDSDGTDEEDDENEKFNQRLINAVRAKPVLYDKYVTDYRKHRLVAAAWQKITLTCKERWNSLRTAYVARKHAKKKQIQSGAKRRTGYTSTSKTYKYAAEMAFIEEFITRNKTNNNITPDVRLREAVVSCTVAPPFIPVFADDDSMASADGHIIGSLPPGAPQVTLESPSADAIACGSAASTNHDPVDDALLNCLSEKQQPVKTPPQTIDDSCHLAGHTMHSHYVSGHDKTASEATHHDDHYGDDVITLSDSDSDGTDEEDYETEKFNQLLINAVGAMPVLYDKSAMNYHNNILVAAAWQTISEELNVPAVTCRKRWKSLRNTYTCSQRDDRRKKLRRPDGKGTTEYTPYKYAAQMSFVDKFVKRRTNNNITPDVMLREAVVPCTSAPPVISGFADDSTPSADVQIGSPPTAQAAWESPSADATATSSTHDPVHDALLNCLNEKQQPMKTPAQTFGDTCHSDGLQTTRNDTPIFEYGQADFVSHLSPDYVYSIVEKIFSVIPVDDVPALKQILDERMAKSGVETRSSANQQCDQSESTPNCLWNAGACGLEDLVLQKNNLFPLTDRVDSRKSLPIAQVSNQVFQRKLVNYSSSESDSDESIMAEHGGPSENDSKGEPDHLVPANGMKANAVDDQCGPYKEMPALENCSHTDPVGLLNDKEIVPQTVENPVQPNLTQTATASTREEKPQSPANNVTDAFEVSLNVDESKKMVHVSENPDTKTISLKINLARMPENKNKRQEKKRRKLNRYQDREGRKEKKRNDRKMYKLCRRMQDDAVDTDFSEDSEVEGRRRRGRVSWTYERCRIVEG